MTVAAMIISDGDTFGQRPYRVAGRHQSLSHPKHAFDEVASQPITSGTTGVMRRMWRIVGAIRSSTDWSRMSAIGRIRHGIGMVAS